MTTKKKRPVGPLWLPEAHFGAIGEDPPESEGEEDDSPDDDEELEQTPEDVVMMLGFDPLEGFDSPT